jgi:hypothetical protein
MYLNDRTDSVRLIVDIYYFQLILLFFIVLLLDVVDSEIYLKAYKFLKRVETLIIKLIIKRFKLECDKQEGIARLSRKKKLICHVNLYNVFYY